MNTITRERRLNERRCNFMVYHPERRNPNNERRVHKSSFWHWFTGLSTMCRRSKICPRFERRNVNGIDGACKNCEYLKRERRQLKILRVITVITFAVFIATTYLRFI